MSMSKWLLSLKQEEYHRKLNNTGWADNWYYTTSEALLHLGFMAKDIINTFSPYKNSSQRKRDLKQFYYGLKNTFLGCWHFLSTSFLNLLGLFVALSIIFIRPKKFWPFLTEVLAKIGRNILGSFLQTLHGLIQIVTSPLSLIRITWRSYLARKMPDQLFQERKSIQLLVKEIDTQLEQKPFNNASVAKIGKALDELARKAKSNQVKQQKTRVRLPLINSELPVGQCAFFPSPERYISKATFINPYVRNPTAAEIEIEKIKTYVDSFRALTTLLWAYARKYTGFSSDNKQPQPETELINKALRFAAAHGNKDDVIFLLDEAKADLLSTSKNGKDALTWAREQGHKTIVKLLEERVAIASTAPKIKPV